MCYKKLANKDGGYQRVGSRTPMQWDHSINDGFSKAKELYLPVNTASDITVEDNLNDEKSLYYFVKELIKIRQNNEDLKGKYMEIIEKNRVINIARGALSLIINLSNDDINLDGEVIISLGKGRTLNPYQSAIIKR